MATSWPSLKSDSNLSTARTALAAGSLAYARPALWGALCALTASLALYPVELTLSYSPIQSVDTIVNLPLFAAIYYAWLATLLLLTWTLRGPAPRATWEALGLVIAFSLVFTGFYLFHEPFPGFRGQSPAQLVLGDAALARGTITAGFTNEGLREWPGVGLLTAPLAAISGDTTWATGTVFLFVYAVLFAALTYLLFQSLLRTRRVAILATLFLLQGSFVLHFSQAVIGYYLGPLWLLAFLVLLNRRADRDWSTVGDRAAGLVLLAATAITHFLSGMLFAATLVGLAASRMLWRREAPHLHSVPLYLLVPAVWLMYWAVETFRGAVFNVQAFVQDALAGQALTYVVLIGRANAGGGGEAPLWAAIVRVLWLFLLLVPGVLVGAWWLLRGRGLDADQQDTVGQFAGVAGFDAATGSVSGGGAYLIRILWHVPFFSVPLMFAFVNRLRRRRLSAALIGLLAITFFATSLPTFFAHHPSQNFDTVYPSEMAAGRFLRANFDRGDSLVLYTSANLYISAGIYWVPNALRQTERNTEGDFTYVRDPDAFWRDWEQSVSNFTAPRPAGDRLESRVYMWSPRVIQPYEHLFGIPRTHPNWQRLQDRLVATSNLVYEDGTTRMYEN